MRPPGGDPLAGTARIDHTPPVRVEVTTRLGDRSGTWDDLVAAQALPSPFLRTWWLDHAAGTRPAVLVCLDGDRVVGGAAFEVDRMAIGPVGVERVRCLGQGELAPDHLDLVAEAGREDEVTERVLGWLRRPGARVVDLDGLAGDGRLARALARHVVDRVPAPYAVLPADAAEYLAGRPGQVRSTVTRSRKRLTKAGATIRYVERAEDGAPTTAAVDTALGALADLHDGRWADESVFLGSWPRFEAAARAGLRRGDVRIVELVDEGGAVVASELDVCLGDRVAFYQAGRVTDREWRGSGSVVRQAAVERAVEDHAREYDLLRGDEPYKSDWATDRREVVRVRFGVGAAGRAAERARAEWAGRLAPAVLRVRRRVEDRLNRRAAS